MTQTARQQVSEMTETTETTLARTFGWETPEARLYRDCPTAFWLAPDAQDYLPSLPEAPMPAEVPEPETYLKDEVEGLRGAVACGALTAGPIFAASLALLLPARGADAWYVPFARAVISLTLAPVTMLVGAAPALLPVLAGVLVLGMLGTGVATLRTPATWAAVGGVIGAAIAALFDAGSTGGLAVIATSVACAAIARHFVTWHDHQAA